MSGDEGLHSIRIFVGLFGTINSFIGANNVVPKNDIEDD